MSLNKIAVYYWKVICNVKTFDLSKKKFRLLTVLFWFIVLTLLLLIGLYSFNFYKKYTIKSSDNHIIEQFEARFPLDRFLEQLNKVVMSISDNINGDLIKDQIIPKGFSKDDVLSLLNKISLHIITRSHDTEYSFQERHLLHGLSKKLNISAIQIQPSDDLIHNCCVIKNLIDNLTDIPFNYQFKDLENKISYLIDMSNSFIISYKDTLEEVQFLEEQECISYRCSGSILDTFKYNKGINFDNLDLESARQISKVLPDEYYNIERYKKLHAENLKSESFYPDYLIEPFRKLSFFEPEGFNPSDFKGNLEFAKNRIGNNSGLYIELIKYIFFLFGVNFIFILLIRIIIWINNG